MKTNLFILSARISSMLFTAVLFSRSEAALPVCEVIPGVQATGVSADGKVIIGSLQEGARSPVRWTKETGVVSLTASYGTAFGTSRDGSVIVGSIGQYGPVAFRWTTDSGFTQLSGLGYGSNVCRATAVSKDGLVAVGWGEGPGGWISSRPYRAVRWLMSSPAEELGDLDPGDGVSASQAEACSSGGLLIFGYGSYYKSSDYVQPGFRWAVAGGMAELPSPSPYTATNGRLEITCCDDSGNIFAGGFASSNHIACYGSVAVQTRLLGDLPGGQHYSRAKAMSGDGLFVGGFGHVAHANEFRARQAFVWSPVYEMENLNFLLFSLGMPQFAGANPQLLLREVVGISDSTDVIVCNGFYGGSLYNSTIRISGLRDFLSGSAPFRINSFYRVSENRVQLSWPCRPGKRYQIQESTNLKDWTNVGNPVTGEAFSLLREVDAQAGSEPGNSRYWRIAQLLN